MFNLFALDMLIHTRVIVWYQTRETFRLVSGIGIKDTIKSKENNFAPIMGDTHKAVCHFYQKGSNVNLDKVFTWLQAENWSPNGEARELIQQLGLSHTSMSVGDIIQVDERFFACEPFGWENITDSVTIPDAERERIDDSLASTNRNT